MPKQQLSYKEKCDIVKEMIGVHPKYLLPCATKIKADMQKLMGDNVYKSGPIFKLKEK